MNRILCLPEQVVHKIAAGEVIERPASVVKELVENSIDAGATRVDVEVREGGKDYIRVADNGSGIHRDDLPLVLTRHATSKIRSAEELFAIKTLGFRGEAIPSIASVSDFTLYSKQAGEKSGYRVKPHADGSVDIQPHGMAPGTVVEVGRLFHNTPARYKFLKATSTEKRYVVNILSEMSIAHPEVALKLVVDGEELFVTPGTGRVEDVLAVVWGARQARNMLPIEYSTDWGLVSGFVGKPEQARGNRSMQTVILNGRVIQCPPIGYCLDRAYRSFLAPRQYPIAVIQLQVDPSQVDVNVHPAKAEVRFAQEKAIVDAVYSAIQSALRHANLAPSLSTAASTSTGSTRTKNEPLFKGPSGSNAEEMFPWRPQTWDNVEKVLHEESPALLGDENRYSIEESQNTSRAEARLGKSVESAQPVEEILSLKGHSDDARSQLVSGKIIGQLLRTYILLEVSSGLWILDQHIVHERILYERYRAYEAAIPTQRLIPQELSLGLSDHERIREQRERLISCGFELEEKGDRLFLTGIPWQFPRDLDWEREILELANELDDTQGWREKRAVSLACRSAVKAGQNLEFSQMQALLEGLRATENPFTCPHGRPIIVRLEQEELLRRFGRK